MNLINYRHLGKNVHDRHDMMLLNVETTQSLFTFFYLHVKAANKLKC